MAWIGKESIRLFREEQDILANVHQQIVAEKEILVKEANALDHLEKLARELYRLFGIAESHMRAFDEHQDKFAAEQIKRDIGMIDELIVPLRKYTQALKGLKPKEWEYTKKLLKLESEALELHKRLSNLINK